LQQLEEKIELKNQVNIAIDNIKPINILKNTMREISTVTNFKENALETILSIAAGFISKKIIDTATHNPAIKTLSSIIQMGVTSIVAKNSSSIKDVAVGMIRKLLQKKSTHY
jgi:hypothetical protein